MCTKWTIAGCLPSTTITLGWQPSNLLPLSAASRQFGIVQVDGSSRVMGFQEKPELPIPVPDDPGHCLVSMGIYVFKTSFLVQELRRKATDIEPGHDFGTHLFPRIIGQERVYAFNFTGLGTGGTAYWRDVGTLDAYYQANMDFLVSDPALDVNEKTWPIYSFQPSFPPPKVTVDAPPSGFVPSGPRLNIIANGTVSEGWLKGSVVGFDCRISAESTVEDSILFDGVSIERGAQVRRAIVDKGVQIRPGARLVRHRCRFATWICS